MAKTVLLAALLSVILLLPLSSLAQVQDYCVADLTQSYTPAGYPCKTKVGARDFYYHGLATPSNITEPFRFGLTLAFVKQFPGLNGLGISALRADIAVGGVIPLHTHPAATELIFIAEGSVNVGFISSSSNTVYTKTLYKGDIFLFPRGLLHFLYNTGKAPVVVLATFNSVEPGLQVTSFALFGNNLPSAVVEKVTFLDDQQVKKLKRMFGGRG